MFGRHSPPDCGVFRWGGMLFSMSLFRMASPLFESCTVHFTWMRNLVTIREKVNNFLQVSAAMNFCS